MTTDQLATALRAGADKALTELTRVETSTNLGLAGDAAVLVLHSNWLTLEAMATSLEESADNAERCPPELGDGL